MCEFTVLLDDGNEKRQVAKNIIKAKMKEGKATLMSSSGEVVKVDASAITVVDTLMTELVLQGSAPSKSAQTEKSRYSSDMEALRRFHGHLGPYVVMGFRMGQLARVAFPKKIFATVYSGTKRPRSCMADGVQFASCCTVGKNNLALIEGNEARAMFTDGVDAFEITVLSKWINKVDKSMTHENEEELSMEIFQAKDDSLFKVRKIKPAEAWKEPQ
jgi:formylmethanofuran dehydrogenase subunit E